MIKAIAFDLDNTLLDTIKYKREVTRAAAKAMIKAGLKKSEKQVYDALFTVYKAYGFEFTKPMSAALVYLGLPAGNRFERIQQAGVNAYTRQKYKSLKPYHDVKPTLKKLKKKGLKLCILSDAPRNKVWNRLDVAGLADMFEYEHVFTFNDILVRKPDQAVFKALLKRLKLKAREVLLLGDALDKDIKGAKEVGMVTAFARYGAYFKSKSNVKPDYEIKKFSEILNILKE